MLTGEEKKDGNRSQDSCSPWQGDQSLTRQRSKARSLSPPLNRNTWLSSTRSRSKSGSSAFSVNSATTSTMRTSSIATIKALSPLLTIQNTMLVRNTSTFNITSSGIVLKTEGLVWNIVQQRTWWQMD